MEIRVDLSRGFRDEARVISAARTSGRDVVYCLKTLVASASERTQWSRSTLTW